MVCSYGICLRFFLGTKNVSSYIYREATAIQTQRVEFKVVRKNQYLPAKYAVLGSGEAGLRVELIDVSKNYAISEVTDKDGIATFAAINAGTYDVNIGKEVAYTPEEIGEIERRGMSLFDPGAPFTTTMPRVTITRDIYLSPIILN